MARKGSGSSPLFPVPIPTAGTTIHHNQQNDNEAKGGEKQAEMHRGMEVSDGVGRKSFNLPAQLLAGMGDSRPQNWSLGFD